MLVVERASDGEAAALEDMGVDHGGFDIFVAEQFLNGADVVAVLEQMGGKRVAEGMTTDGFIGDTSQSGGSVNCFSLAPPARAGVQAAFIDVVAALGA